MKRNVAVSSSPKCTEVTQNSLYYFQSNTRECDGVPERHGVRSLPTFIFYKNRQMQRDLQFVGADVEKLERVVQQNIMPTTFTGSGNRLGGSGLAPAEASAPAPAVNSRPQGKRLILSCTI